MQFLWQLLPGARETRNQVIVGYAWVIAVGLWLGVPVATRGSGLAELTNAVGPIGIGIALGFAAFFVGSLSDDIISRLVGIRGAAAFSLARRAVEVELWPFGSIRTSVPDDSPQESNVDALRMIKAMSDSVRAELERLEASIDRSGAEVALRLGLVAPVVVACVAGARDNWRWGLAGAITAAALLWQARTRYAELNANTRASGEIREGVADDARRGAYAGNN